MGAEASLDLQLIYQPIQREMMALSQFLKAEFHSREPFIWDVLQHIARFRGKQIRPALLFLVSKAGASEAGEDHIKIAAVIELIHTATLVHDDVLDDARLRRDVETVHRRWGERAAVLIGDYIYSRAFSLSTEVPGMAGLLAETTHAICEGELLQIATRFQEIDEATYLQIIRKKTAILYGVSCQIGGMLGGLEAERCLRFRDFGMELGTAFQIVDDCLDYKGTEAVAGKSLGTDLHQGKVTLPLILLMETTSEAERRHLLETLSRPLSLQAEDGIRRLVEERGVVPEARARAEAFIQSGKDILLEISSRSPRLAAVHDSLDSVADYIVRRQR